MKKRGFTLIELLIAAAIIGALAVLSTNAYKNSMMRGRIESGKSRARTVAAAVQRFKVDYPSSTFTGDILLPLSSLAACAVGSSVAPGQLIQCGYLDNRPWSDGYTEIEVCGAKTTGLCGNTASAVPSKKYLVCMTGTGDKMPRYNGKSNYLFCVSARGESESGAGL
jgi:prepilin-type N-terminal cleavage/methylation domain-containing protein